MTTKIVSCMTAIEEQFDLITNDERVGTGSLKKVCTNLLAHTNDLEEENAKLKEEAKAAEANITILKLAAASAELRVEVLEERYEMLAERHDRAIGGY